MSIERKLTEASAKAAAKAKAALIQKRQVIWLCEDEDKPESARRPALVTRVGGDGSTHDTTTIYYSFVNADGALGASGHITSWALDRRFEAGTAGLVDGAEVRTRVTLPPSWQTQAENHAEAVAKARKSRAWVSNEREPVAHPSYGVVTLSRLSGHSRLYGTPFEHYSMIRLSVYRATDLRQLSGSRPFAGEQLIEIRMSEAQFARMITSPGNGEGTACTLSTVFGQSMPEPPGQDEVEEFHEDVKRTVKDGARHVTDAIAAARAAIQRSKLSGKAASEILASLAQVEKTYADAIPFTVKRFHERMDEIVLEGKTEIDAYLTQRGAVALPGAVPVALPAPKDPEGKP